MKSKVRPTIKGKTKRIRIYLQLFDKNNKMILSTSRMIKSKIDALIEHTENAESGYIKVCYSPEMWNDGTYKLEELKQVLIDWTSQDMIESSQKEYK